MLARAITPYPVTAFTGREYVRYEFRPVPVGCEDEARRNPYLELQEDEPQAVEKFIDAVNELPNVETVKIEATVPKQRRKRATK